MFFTILCCALWVFEEWGCCHFWTADLHWVSLFNLNILSSLSSSTQDSLAFHSPLGGNSLAFLYPLGGAQNWIHSLHSRATSEEDGGNAQLPSFAYWCIDGMSKVTPTCSGSWVTLWSLANTHLVSVSQQKFLHASIIRHMSWARERVRDLIYEECLQQLSLLPSLDVTVYPVVSSWGILDLWAWEKAEKGRTVERQSSLAFRVKSSNLCSCPKLILGIFIGCQSCTKHQARYWQYNGKHHRRRAYKIW